MVTQGENGGHQPPKKPPACAPSQATAIDSRFPECELHLQLYSSKQQCFGVTREGVGEQKVAGRNGGKDGEEAGRNSTGEAV